MLKERYRGLIRRVFHIPMMKYECWCTDNILHPDVFDELEWETFRHLFLQMGGGGADTSFAQSSEGRQTQIADDLQCTHTDNKNYKEFIKFRNMTIHKWTVAFIDAERIVYANAARISASVMELLAEEMYLSCAAVAVKEKVFAVMEKEQRRHEGISAYADEVSRRGECDIIT